MNSQILRYETAPRYDLWLKLILGGVLGLTFVLGLVYVSFDIVAAYWLLGITLFDALLFWAILPQRFLIYEDRLVIKLGGPFAVTVKLVDIKEAKPTSSRKVFMYWGTRFATSTTGVVEIVRQRGLSIVISPRDAEVFIEELNNALPQSTGGNN